MTFEEIDERYRDAALDADAAAWKEDEVPRETAWDDPAQLVDDEDELEDPDEA